MTAAEVARKAADLLERDGWCQGLFRDGTRRCLSAAITAAVADVSAPRRDIADEVVRDALRRHTGMTSTRWNDAPERTGDDVIALLRQVANELEAS